MFESSSTHEASSTSTSWLHELGARPNDAGDAAGMPQVPGGHCQKQTLDRPVR